MFHMWNVAGQTKRVTRLERDRLVGHGQHQFTALHKGTDIERMGVRVNRQIRLPFAHQHFIETFFYLTGGEFFKCLNHACLLSVVQDDQSSIIFRHKGSEKATW